jgi:hypothetical protein
MLNHLQIDFQTNFVLDCLLFFLIFVPPPRSPPHPHHFRCQICIDGISASFASQNSTNTTLSLEIDFRFLPSMKT